MKTIDDIKDILVKNSTDNSVLKYLDEIVSGYKQLTDTYSIVKCDKCGKHLFVANKVCGSCGNRIISTYNEHN